MSEKELEATKKKLADAEAAAKEARKQADDNARERDVAEAELRASRMRPPASTGTRGTTKHRTEPVVPEDIRNTQIRQIFDDARNGASRFNDSPEGRLEMADMAQDALIGLRLLNVGYAGHGVQLYPGGDLYIHAAGVHPREAAQHLVKHNDVGDLADLLEELREKLEYEAA